MKGLQVKAVLPLSTSNRFHPLSTETSTEENIEEIDDENGRETESLNAVFIKENDHHPKLTRKSRKLKNIQHNYIQEKNSAQSFEEDTGKSADNSMKTCDINSISKYHLKKCPWCAFKKRSCALNRSKCTASEKNCYNCG